ncbi:transcriptional regulator [Nocardioides sp. NPDC058538]|uniref:transcriptional regulator n=1 Tax=Nocardioides sp. NPDC058538 TaxID=3346542 RepID=UPI0036613678
MRTRTTVRTCRSAAVGLSLGLALTLSGCGSDDTKADADAAVDVESSAPASESASAAPVGDEAEVKVGKTLEDPEMGDKIEVVSAVRDFPSAEEAELIAEGGEVVLVQVKIKPGKEYGGRISEGNFEISWDKGADFESSDTRLMTEEMTAAKRTPLEDVQRRDGGEHTGWIAFQVDEKADTYLIEYTRDGAKVIGSDKTIAEFTEQVEIPAG